MVFVIPGFDKAGFRTISRSWLRWLKIEFHCLLEQGHRILSTILMVFYRAAQRDVSIGIGRPGWHWISARRNSSRCRKWRRKSRGGGEPLSVVSGSERHMDPNCQGTRRNSLKSFKRSSTRCVCAGPRLTRGLGRLEKSES